MTPPLPTIPEIIAAVTPTADEVAALERTRTVGMPAAPIPPATEPLDPLAPGHGMSGLGGDTGPTDFTYWSDTTRPTLAEVNALIPQAVNGVLTRLPMFLPEVVWPRVRHLAALYCAILVESSYFREQIDEGSVELYRRLLDDGIAKLNEELDESNRMTVDSVGVTGEAGAADWTRRLGGYGGA